MLVHHDTDRYDLRIRAHGRTSVIATTSNHLFWVPGTGGHRGGWVKAGALRYGTYLRTPSGSVGGSVTVAGDYASRQSSGWMWDLTIPGNGDHDFYIDVINTAVLVHNCPAEYKPWTAKFRTCLAGALQMVSLFHGGIASGKVGTPPDFGNTYQYSASGNSTGAPPTPGNDGGGEGGGGGEDGC